MPHNTLPEGVRGYVERFVEFVVQWHKINRNSQRLRISTIIYDFSVVLNAYKYTVKAIERSVHF